MTKPIVGNLQGTKYTQWDSTKPAISIQWTGLRSGLWDWTHRKLHSGG